MKKIISIFLCLALMGCIFAGCAKQEDLKSDIVLITNAGTINDDGYNQSAWEGIEAFADENSMTCRYYKPVLDDNGEITVENIEKYVSLSVENGASYIVLPGEEFAVSAYEIAPSYPDTNFILIDAVPHSADDDTDRYINNVMCVSFDAVQGGFLAGYVSVLNGNTELGYFGQVSSDDSANYGAGFVQGAAYAADSLGIPVTVDWADYDSALLDYDYGFTVKACYEKVDDQSEETFKVNVVNGLGTGTYTKGSNVTITANPAPEGQVFDKWEVKSDTEGVKDSKVNISSENDASMNLIAEKCDCTLTATYKDADGAYNVDVMSADGSEVYSTVSVEENGECSITAPVAEDNMVFDHWQTDASVEIEDETSASTTVRNINDNVKLIPVYSASEEPTFNIEVVTGEGGNGESTGSGSYVAGDLVTVVSAPPADGYMFSHWENVDAYGNQTGIAMDNEYNYSATFEMTDRYAAICDTMFNHGVTTIFTGGNGKADSAFTSKGDYDCDLNIITAGAKNNDAYFTVVKNYGEAVKDCLREFKGGSIVTSGCATDGLYLSFVSDDEDVQKQYDEMYKNLASGKMPLIQAQGGAGYDFCEMYNKEKPSKCLTLNGWFLEGVSLSQQ